MPARKTKPQPVEGTWVPTPAQASGPARKAIDIDADLHSQLKELATRNSVTLREVCEAAIRHSLGELEETPAA